MTTPPRATHPSDTDLHYLRRSFVRHLAADRRSAATRAAYGAAIDQLEAFLAAQGLPTTVRQLQPDDVDAFFVSLHERQLRPSTILARHHALSRFFQLAGGGGRARGLPDGAAASTYGTPPPADRADRRPDPGAAGCLCRGAFEDFRDAALI